MLPTPKQLRVERAIAAFTAEHGFAPSVRELAEQFHNDRSEYAGLLDRKMEQRGRISATPACATVEVVRRMKSNPLAIRNGRAPRQLRGRGEPRSNLRGVDECKEMADKPRALAAYARQANDETLYMARRIQARALRRVGETVVGG